MPKRPGGAQRSQSRAAAGSVVGGLEAPAAHSGRGARCLRALRHAGAFRARFLKSRFPNGTWTSIAVLFNPRMGLHRDIQNMHDKPVSFDARRYHMVEPHEGSMWALAAYVPQAYACSTSPRKAERSGLSAACLNPQQNNAAASFLYIRLGVSKEFFFSNRGSDPGQKELVALSGEGVPALHSVIATGLSSRHRVRIRYFRTVSIRGPTARSSDDLRGSKVFAKRALEEL